MATSRKRGWSWATGEKGKNRVRVYDRGSRGIFLDVSVRHPLLGTATRKRIGAHRPVDSLDHRDWDGFIRDRRAGRIRPASVEEERAVRSRTVQKDLRLLLAVFNWAAVVRKADGKRLLVENPFAGFAVPHEESPRPPILTHDDFEKLLAADIDFRANTIRWRGEHDKIGHEHLTPLVDAAKAASIRHRAGAVTGDESPWVFPAPEDSTQPMSRHLARDWWQRAEAAAEIARVPGRGWHSIRRKFATGLKGASLKDLCALGGWKDHNTILECYQQPDPDTMRVALENRGTLRSVRAS